MTDSINIKAMKGMVPRTDSPLLNGNYASQALNCKLTSGRVDPIKGLSLVHTSLAASIASMYRYRNAGADYWLTWTVPVDVVRSPTAQDSLNRVFWTGDGEPRMTTFADGIAGGGPYPAAWFVLGVYVPTLAAGLSVVGGSGTVETREYLYTFKTQYSEESGPSPAVSASGFINGSWNLTGMEAAPPNAGTVSGATNLGGGLVRVTVDTSRGLAPYEQVTFAGVTGMTDLNATLAISAIPDATHVDVVLTTAQAYTAGGTWARRASHNLANMVRCIYRRFGTDVNYKKVVELPVATTTYNDTVASTALGITLPTLLSFPPPKNGHSIVAMANGSHAMLAGNELCISEQYKPYSYPLGNRYAFDGTGVALVAAGNSLIVMRLEGKPRVYTATVPEAASGADLPTPVPCINKYGVVDGGGYALCPSHDGLYAISPSSAQNLTAKLYGPDDWKAINPTTFRAVYFQQSYYAMRTAGAGKRMLVLNMAAMDEGVREVDETADALLFNNLDGLLYLAKANKVYQFDADDSNRYLSFWQSPDFYMGELSKFTAAQVFAEYSQIVPPDTSVAAANAALIAAGDILGAFGDPSGVVPWGATNLTLAPSATANRIQFSLLRDGSVFFTTSLSSSKPFRLPRDVRSEVYAVQIASSIPWRIVGVAPTMHDLQAVSQ